MKKAVSITCVICSDLKNIFSLMVESLNFIISNTRVFKLIDLIYLLFVKKPMKHPGRINLSIFHLKIVLYSCYQSDRYLKTRLLREAFQICETTKAKRKIRQNIAVVIVN